MTRLILTKARLWISLSVFFPVTYAFAQDVTPDSWSLQKCALYSAAWGDVRKSYDLTGASPEFLADHQSFVDQGCPGEMRVCAVTAKDIELANTMIILSMNEGMASTFAPFGCTD